MEKSATKKMMSNMLRFFVKRVFILYVVLIVACFLLNNHRISMVIALTATTLVTLLRFALFEYLLTMMQRRTKNKTFGLCVSLYILNLAIIGALIVIAVKISIPTFFAALAGTFLLVVILMVNAMTEALGITKNHFGQKVR